MRHRVKHQRNLQAAEDGGDELEPRAQAEALTKSKWQACDAPFEAFAVSCPFEVFAVSAPFETLR